MLPMGPPLKSKCDTCDERYPATRCTREHADTCRGLEQPVYRIETVRMVQSAPAPNTPTGCSYVPAPSTNGNTHPTTGDGKAVGGSFKKWWRDTDGDFQFIIRREKPGSDIIVEHNAAVDEIERLRATMEQIRVALNVINPNIEYLKTLVKP